MNTVAKLGDAFQRITRYSAVDWIAGLKPIIEELEQLDDAGAKGAGRLFGAGLGVLRAMGKELDSDAEAMAMHAVGFMAKGHEAFQSFRRSKGGREWPGMWRYANELRVLDILGALSFHCQEVLDGVPGGEQRFEALYGAMMEPPKKDGTA